MSFEYVPEIVKNSNEKLEKVEQAENELSLSEKQCLVDEWKTQVIDSYFGVEGIEGYCNKELKQELNESLMEDIKHLSNEWKIELNKDLPEEEYLEEMRAQINNLDKKDNKGTHWDSWPKKMREDGGFNCVGATLLGIKALKEKGIESYYGNPWGHVVNIAKLSDGRWIYIDLKNNKAIEIYPKEIRLGQHRVLEVNNEDIDYKLIPIHDDSVVVGSIIGNISVLEAEKGNEKGCNICQTIKQKLFPEFKEVEDAEEMKKEKERVEFIQEAEREATDYLNNLSEEKRREMLQEVTIKKELIKKVILGDSLLQGNSDELQEFIRLMIVGLNGISKKEIKEEAISRFLSKINKL